MFLYYYSTLSFALESIRFIIIYLNILLSLEFSHYFSIINKNTEHLYEHTFSSVVWNFLLMDSQK